MVVYSEFSPYLFEYMKGGDIVEMDNFDDAVDKYYECQMVKKTQKEEIKDKAMRKYENMKQDQIKRIGILQ